MTLEFLVKSACMAYVFSGTVPQLGLGFFLIKLCCIFILLSTNYYLFISFYSCFLVPESTVVWNNVSHCILLCANVHPTQGKSAVTGC